MGTIGQQIFASISSGLASVLNRARTQAASALNALAPEPGFTGSVLDGRLLAEFDPSAIVPSDAGVTALLSGLEKILPSTGSNAACSLHGYDPGNGQPRGLALAMTTTAPAVTFVAGLTGAGPAGLAFELAAVGTGAFGPTTLPLLGGWSIVLSGDAGGGGRLEFPFGASPQVLDGLSPISISISLQHASSDSPIVLGPADSATVTIATVSVGAVTSLDANGNPHISYVLSLPDAKLGLVSGVISALLGDSFSMPIDLELAADPVSGIALKSGGVQAAIPVNLSLPGIDINALDLALSATAGTVQFDFGMSFTGSLPGIPLTLSVEGLGAGFPISTGQGPLGLDPSGVQPLFPTGLGLDLDLPVISGGGFLDNTGPGGYGGILNVELLDISIDAFGLLQLPVNGLSLSFVAIISLQFPFPGIELQFGFSLNGVGGIVAVNRRLDTPSLEAAVVNGSARQLLFPVDPAAHGPAIIATLGQVFPPADGHVVVGPMLQVDWGGRIVSGVLAVVVDLPDPVQFVLIGRIIVALPDPDVPLVLLQATFVGAFEISPVASVALLASLDGSKIAGMPLNGDIFFLLQAGDDPEFVFTAGGFNPKYSPPAAVPAKLQRLQLDITPPGFPGLRADAYFAVTANSVQFGARLELSDEVAGCGIDGWFSFDALFKWDPVFSFSIHASAGVAVQVFGDTLCGINIDLLLEGPSPWHVHGTGSISLFLFSVSLDFDAHWGSAPPALPVPSDLGSVLAAALAKPSAWKGAAPAGENPLVTLSSGAKKLVSRGQSVHPLGGVTVRQRAVPFDIAVSRFQQQPIQPQTWSIAAAALAPDVPAALGNLTQDRFAPGQFETLTEDQQLSRPAFELMDSGVAMTPVGGVHSDLRPVDTDYETVLIPDLTPIPFEIFFVDLVAESFLAIDDVQLHPVLWSPPGLQGIAVLTQQPVTVATTDTFSPSPGFVSPGGYTATLQAAQGMFGAVGPAAGVQVVEAWEVSA
jgi:hypothetical protein